MTDLIKKIHQGSDNTCFPAIMMQWEENNPRYDKCFIYDEFIEECQKVIDNKTEDAYFSVNSYYKRSRKTTNLRHINAFILDFDFYHIKEYQQLNSEEFYREVIKEKLPFKPTGVVDSGRGLYVIYSFKHCSYHIESLYKQIWYRLFVKFQPYGMDPRATLSTQLIRIPGTINSRSGKEVRILEFNDTDYTIQDFATLLKYSREEIKKLKSKKKKMKKRKGEAFNNLEKRKPHFKEFFDDCKKIIEMRNEAKIEDGYREILLYIVRERATWSGYTVDESVQLAYKLNDLFKQPLDDDEVEKQCKPSEGRQKCSINTIISKLSITYEEQRKLKVLRKRELKKSEYAFKKRRHKLLNRTNKQQKLLERRTQVCFLKNKKHLRNAHIANILGVDKSTVTRDIQYIQQHASQFVYKLEDYLSDLLGVLDTEKFRRITIYDRVKQLSEWVISAQGALEFLTRKLGVAKT